MAISNKIIFRILVALFLISIISGIVWYLLRHNPGEDVFVLRTKINQLLNSKDPEVWEMVTTEAERKGKNLNDLKIRAALAREASEALLKINPESLIDQINRGIIEEFAGNFDEALSWYNKISSLKKAPPGVELDRARVYRKLGLYQDAIGIASGVLDVFPFDSNLIIGELHLDSLNADRALVSFNRAEPHTHKDEELRQVYEGKAKALQLKITTFQHMLKQEMARSNENSRTKELAANIDKLKQEYQHTLDMTLRFWKRADPKTRGEFAAVHWKIIEILNKREDMDVLRASRKGLSEAEKEDEENKNFSISLMLATVNLKLAYDAETLPEKIDFYLEEAEASLQKAFLFNPERKSTDFGYIDDWNLPHDISPKTFQAHILTRACQTLLNFPDIWRILKSSDDKGKPDPLKISQKVESLLNDDEVDEAFRNGLRTCVALALLKTGDLDGYQREFNTLLQSDLKQGTQRSLLGIARGISTVVPGRTEVLLQLVDKYFWGQLTKDLLSFEEKLRYAKNIIDILDQARKFHYSETDAGNRQGFKENSKEKGKASRLTAKIKEILELLPGAENQPDRFLLTANLMRFYVGSNGAIEVLQKGKAQFPNNPKLRLSLGRNYLEKAQYASNNTEKKDFLRDALSELLSLYVQKPYRIDILKNLMEIQAGYQGHQEKWFLDLETSLVPEFPNATQSELRLLAELLHVFLLQDFTKVISKLPPLDDAMEVRPFLNLIGGVSYLQVANAILQKSLLEKSPTSETLKPNQFQGELKEYYEKAQREFEKGIAVNPSYLPIKIDLFKMNLDTISAGAEPSKELLEEIREFRGLYPHISQLHLLQAKAIQKRMEYLIRTSETLKKIGNLLWEQRSSIRKAIQIDPSDIDSYLALAETYVITWRLDFGPLAEYKKFYDELGRPELGIAESILENAPQSPKVLKRLLSYYEADLKPEKSLEAYKALFIQQPSWEIVKNIVETYISLAKYDKARKWLKGLKRLTFLNNTEINRRTLLAVIDTMESASPRTSDERRMKLTERQIKNYQLAIDEAKKSNEEPPPEAVNNLAYLLVNNGKVKEALELIEPLFTKFVNSNLRKNLTQQQFEGIEETYAWTLFKGGKMEQSEEIYKRLCAKEVSHEINFNYATLLFDSERYEEAMKQVEVILKGNQHLRITDEKARRLREKIKKKL